MLSKIIKNHSDTRVKKAAALLLCCYVFFVINYSSESDHYSRRMLSISQNCTIKPSKEVSPDDSPIFIASFPGSGARMSWRLVEGLTGKPTGDEWDSNGLGRNVIAVKTHFPHPTHGNKLEWGEEIERALILTRNPLHALPEFHNSIYSYTLEGNDNLEMVRKTPLRRAPCPLCH